MIVILFVQGGNDVDCTFTGFLMSVRLLGGDDDACMCSSFSMSAAGLSVKSNSGGVHALPISGTGSGTGLSNGLLIVLAGFMSFKGHRQTD